MSPAAMAADSCAAQSIFHVPEPASKHRIEVEEAPLAVIASVGIEKFLHGAPTFVAQCRQEPFGDHLAFQTNMSPNCAVLATPYQASRSNSFDVVKYADPNPVRKRPRTKIFRLSRATGSSALCRCCNRNRPSGPTAAKARFERTSAAFGIPNKARWSHCIEIQTSVNALRAGERNQVGRDR
jgi:hypothetical protein